MMKGDGNGNLTIPGWFLAVMALMIAIISSVASVVAMGTTLRNDVDSLQEDWAKSGPIHTQTINDIKEEIQQGEKTDTMIITKLENIEKKIDKLDAKIEKLQGVK